MYTIKVTSNIRKIDKILKKYWEKQASKEKPAKPRLKIVFITYEENKKIKGYLYALHIKDGYYNYCVLDELVTGTEERFNKRYANKLIKKFIDYCNKERVFKGAESITVNLYPENKIEMKLFKKLGFEIGQEVSGIYYIKWKGNKKR